LAHSDAGEGDVVAEFVLARDIARRQGAPTLEERASQALSTIAPVSAQD
jgi:hypothetical protein